MKTRTKKYQNLRDVVKSVVRGDFIAVNAYIKKKISNQQSQKLENIKKVDKPLQNKKDYTNN